MKSILSGVRSITIAMVAILVLVGGSLIAQESQLATQYYRDGEYQKAAALYKKLSDNYKGKTNYYFNSYIKSLIAAKESETAEKELKAAIKKNKSNSELYVSYGDMLEALNEPERAKEQYLEGINVLGPDVSNIMRLGSAFVRSAKYDLAEETYQKGVQLMGDEKIFAMNLADLYRRKDDHPKMIQYYLSGIRYNPKNYNTIKNALHRYITEDGYTELKKQLYVNIKDYPDQIGYVELLQWTFVQEQDYASAYRQARSLDRKLEENGIRVFNLGNLAKDDEDYPAAIKAYSYIVEDKGPNSTYYVNANKSILQCKQAMIMGDFVYTDTDLDTLDNEYAAFVDRFGVNTSTATIIVEYAEFLALHRGKTNKSIQLLEQLKQINGLPSEQKAYIKLDLADYYLISGDIWEATLLYSQIDKAHKEEYVGELARYRNAMFSYYTGDFEWSQEQFDILKSSTSKLISNDAIDRSVFIMDNLGLDTTTVPMELYAEAELLAFQNRHTASFAKLDSILLAWPEHGLKDDILYVKAKSYRQQMKYQEAVDAYKTIISDFPEDIRCDNALYELAELYEHQLDNPEKAKELYETIFIDYSNSTFAIDARKHFRRLRGDTVQ